MKFYEISLKPRSPFGTLLKGDTLFGQFCWQMAHDPALMTGTLADHLQRYDENPFIVFSSAFPLNKGGEYPYLLPKPAAANAALPSGRNGGRKAQLISAKQRKEKKWMALKTLQPIDLRSSVLLSDKEAAETLDGPGLFQRRAAGSAAVMDDFSQAHNTINRITGTTGPDRFAPFAKENRCYHPDIILALFVLLDETVISIENALTALERIGRWGFGRDASTGLGRYHIIGQKESEMPELNGADALYTLAPAVPEKNYYSKMFFSPFVRFGKHGDRLAVGRNPFKRPVVMADEGALLIPRDKGGHHHPYVGTAVRDVSYLQQEAVAQGYAPCLPLNLEGV